MSRRLRRLAGRHRRLIAAVFAAASVAFTISAVRAPAAEAVRVLVASRDLPPGATLRAADVTTASFPPTVVPATALRASGQPITGRRLAGPMRRGEPFTDVAFGRAALFRTGSQPGSVATPVRIADSGTARLLRPGDRVDVLAAQSGERPAADALTTDEPAGPEDSAGVPADPPTATVVAAGVRVVAVPRTRPVITAEEGALVILETTGEQARVLAGSAANSRLSVTLLQEG